MLLLIQVAVLSASPAEREFFRGLLLVAYNIIEAASCSETGWCLGMPRVGGFSIQPRARFHFSILLVEAFLFGKHAYISMRLYGSEGQLAFGCWCVRYGLYPGFE
jgi:hypothetical protein